LGGVVSHHGLLDSTGAGGQALLDFGLAECGLEPQGGGGGGQLPTTFLMSVLLDPTAAVAVMDRESGGLTADQLSAVIQTVR
jgi:hypothetical protein